MTTSSLAEAAAAEEERGESSSPPMAGDDDDNAAMTAQVSRLKFEIDLWKQETKNVMKERERVEDAYFATAMEMEQWRVIEDYDLISASLLHLNGMALKCQVKCLLDEQSWCQHQVESRQDVLLGLLRRQLARRQEELAKAKAVLSMYQQKANSALASAAATAIEQQQQQEEKGDEEEGEGMTL